MVLVNPGNDALAAAVSRARQLDQKVQSTYVVGISGTEGGYSVVLATVSQSGARAYHGTDLGVASVKEIGNALQSLARCARVDTIDLVFLDQEGSKDFRRKWVLIDPKTLAPRELCGEVVERFYNPT
jgi:hypothetical protein